MDPILRELSTAEAHSGGFWSVDRAAAERKLGHFLAGGPSVCLNRFARAALAAGAQRLDCWAVGPLLRIVADAAVCPPSHLGDLPQRRSGELATAWQLTRGGRHELRVRSAEGGAALNSREHCRELSSGTPRSEWRFWLPPRYALESLRRGLVYAPIPVRVQGALVQRQVMSPPAQPHVLGYVPESAWLRLGDPLRNRRTLSAHVPARLLVKDSFGSGAGVGVVSAGGEELTVLDGWQQPPACELVRCCLLLRKGRGSTGRLQVVHHGDLLVLEGGDLACDAVVDASHLPTDLSGERLTETDERAALLVWVQTRAREFCEWMSGLGQAQESPRGVRLVRPLHAFVPAGQANDGFVGGAV